MYLSVALEVLKMDTVATSLSLFGYKFFIQFMKIKSNHCSIFRYSLRDDASFPKMVTTIRVPTAVAN
ncbi:unnamed protein product [Larinioides sclopetarius]|uniref:Uncharacterized protein n=1 Tax=Larinioides sclopetarius TaxID=280406 RepID=A0AAV2ABX5_9ARAC